MSFALETAAAEWSRNVSLFEPLSAVLGEGAAMMPVCLFAALVWLAIHLLTVPVCSALAPQFIKDVRAVAERKALDKAAADGRKGAEAALEVERAVQDGLNDVGVRTVALIFSIVASFGAMRLMWDSPPQYSKDFFFSSSPAALFYAAVATGYFIWDVFISVYYGYGPAFLIHAVGGLFCELCFMLPFSQVVLCFTHLFELSTPFLNIRCLMLASGKTKSLAFTFCNVGFALTFFASRIVYGYIMSWDAVSRIVSDLVSDNSEIRGKSAALVPVGWCCVVVCVTMAGLNGFWFVLIVRSVLGGGKKKKDE